MAKRPSEDLRIVLRNEKHDRGGFTCGVESLDRYLKTQAGQDVRRKANAVFILGELGEPAHILGYYTLCAMAISQGDVPEAARKHVPRYPLVSATLIGRLAVAKDHQGQRLGAVLLADALQRAFESASTVGSSMVVGGGARQVGGRLLRSVWVRAIAGFAEACAADASCERDG